MRILKLFLLFLLIFPSCTALNPERMLRTPGDFQFGNPADLLANDQYRLAPNDEITFRLFTNEGEILIDPVSVAAGHQIINQTVTYLIEHDGSIKLPVLGFTDLAGLTIREAEVMLEKEFSRYYNNPFVQIRVVNNRVIVFPGGRGGASNVIYLENTNTTLFEALARAGGIADGKASRVKLIRNGDGNAPQIYLINLATIEGINNGNIVVQANDIIYVEPRARVGQLILENITPYLSVVTAALLVYSLFTR
ncbi:MAG TPA: polysaccharide biosynthesis/export family protein [Bacteroidales bacterium]|nr:polysaccharide biosynthesis/export family protein [Bacteroidales bacterium]